MKLIIDEQSEGTRLDLFLAQLMPNVSRTKIQSQIKNRKCLVNNKPAKSSLILKNDDIIEFELPEDNTRLEPEPENITLNVIWENKDMAVINKPSGMLTHPTTTEISGTLVNALLYKYGKEGLSDINGILRPGIIHRLDRNTSGLIMIAKNNKTHEFLVEEMKQKRFSKKYLAIIKGYLEKNDFEINKPIGRHPIQPHKMSCDDNAKDVKESLTIVKNLERLNGASLIELTLVTGRTHQIRVHLSSIGHPVYNDTLYGFGKTKIKTEEQVLQSYKLEFTEPFTKNRICLEIEPDDKITKVHKALKIL